MYIIIRNNLQFGPYSLDILRQYVESGQLLRHDQAFDCSIPSDLRTVGYYLKKNHIRVKIPNNGSLFKQIKTMGRELIFPKGILNRKSIRNDIRLLVLSIIGLVPLLLIIPLGWFVDAVPYLVFYSVSLYFSVIWGLFFYYFFKTSQVSIKRTILIFFGTQLFVFLIFGVGVNLLNPFYLIGIDSGFIGRLIFFVFAVGVTEEIVKALPLWIVLSRAHEPIIPQTLVFYGLMSGIAFGVFEGVDYQMGVNSELGYTGSFFMNVARLTCLPFLHAIWCGISGYFCAFAQLYPKYRKGLYFLSIAIPALLHGLYDTFGGSVVGIVISFIGVVLLMAYLKMGVNNQSILRK